MKIKLPSTYAIRRKLNVYTSLNHNAHALVSNDNVTWSSSGSSQKQGIYLAHSTSIRSCCFIESLISLAVAILFCERSSALHEDGDVACNVWVPVMLVQVTDECKLTTRYEMHSHTKAFTVRPVSFCCFVSFKRCACVWLVLSKDVRLAYVTNK